MLIAAIMSAIVVVTLSPTVGGLFSLLIEMSTLLLLPPYWW
jgi:hypothetical protein